jgi:GTPase
MNGSISLSPEPRMPRVAIMGRANVGKSTLFNGIIGKRRSITSPVSGVTRDFVEATCNFGGRDVVLLDTGGFQLNEQGLDAIVSQKSVELLEKADLILLVVDVTTITPEDEEFIEIARQFSPKIILVINKVDNSRREEESWNLYNLGFHNTVAVSAEHRRNIDGLKNAIVEMLSQKISIKEPVEDVEQIRISIAGKPNTGKSTLLNTLLGFDRSIVAPVAGTTRDVIEGGFTYNGRMYTICDTGGIRRKRSVESDVEYYVVNRAIENIGNSDIVLLTIDSTEGVSDQDKKIAYLAARKGKGILLVFNKWDLLEKIPNSLQAVSDRTKYVFPILDFAPFVPISALENTGIKELLDAAEKIWAQLHIEIPTGRLNQAVQKWSLLKSPPSDGQKRYKARYLTQTSVNPVKFLLFVNRSKGFPKTWVSYVKNCMRAEFGLSSIPFSIDIREG